MCVFAIKIYTFKSTKVQLLYFEAQIYHIFNCKNTFCKILMLFNSISHLNIFKKTAC